MADAAILVALRQALGPHPTLRADANRRWALQEAVAFALAAATAGLEVTIAGSVCCLLLHVGHCNAATTARKHAVFNLS